MAIAIAITVHIDPVQQQLLHLIQIIIMALAATAVGALHQHAHTLG